MKKETSVKSYLDEFNYIIMDIKNINIIISYKNQAILVLCSLSSYHSFVDTLLYENESISIKDMSSVLKSKELKK